MSSWWARLRWFHRRRATELQACYAEAWLEFDDSGDAALWERLAANGLAKDWPSGDQ